VQRGTIWRQVSWEQVTYQTDGAANRKMKRTDKGSTVSSYKNTKTLPQGSRGRKPFGNCGHSPVITDAGMRHVLIKAGRRKNKVALRKKTLGTAERSSGWGFMAVWGRSCEKKRLQRRPRSPGGRTSAEFILKEARKSKSHPIRRLRRAEREGGTGARVLSGDGGWEREKEGREQRVVWETFFPASTT